VHAKIKAYRELCKKQFEDNLRMKQVKRDQEELLNENKGTGRDLMGQLFERKEHQSYALQKANEKKLQALAPKMNGGRGAQRIKDSETSHEVY